MAAKSCGFRHAAFLILTLYFVQCLAGAALWLVPLDERVESDGTEIYLRKGVHPPYHFVPGVGALLMLDPHNYHITICVPGQESRWTVLDVPLNQGLKSVEWDSARRCLLAIEDGDVVAH